MPQTTKLDITLLKENLDNPRTITEAKLASLVKSIQEFPEMLDLRPLVITGDHTVLGGNMRLRACKQAGLTHVPVIMADSLTEAQRREFIIKDNIGFGEWDWPAIAAQWPEAAEWGLDIPAWANKGEAVEDDYEIPDEIKTDIVLGDLFEIGPHRLVCGDSTKAEDVARLMNGQKADMVFTDPPYGVNYDGGMNKKKREKLEGDLNANLYSDAMIQSSLFAKSSAPIYLWFAGTIGKPVYQAVSDNGYNVRAMIVWNKLNAHYGNFMAQYMQKHEPCLYCVKDKPNWYGATNEVTVWDITQPKKNEHHPTQKPVELAAKALNNSSKSEDIILDFFLGSGTTMVAAHQLNRKCYGIEIDPKYCQVIVDRMLKLDPSLSIKKNGLPLPNASE